MELIPCITTVNRKRYYVKKKCFLHVAAMFLLVSVIHFVNHIIMPLPGIVYFTVTGILFCCLFYKIAKYYSIFTAFFGCLIFAAPFNQYTIFGTQGFMSYFLLFNVAFIVYLLIRGYRCRSRLQENGLLGILGLLVVSSLIPLLNSENFRSGVNDWIQNILVFITLYFVATNKKRFDGDEKKFLYDTLILMSTVLACGILIQFFGFFVLKTDFFGYSMAGPERYTFSLWFLDFSSNGMLIALGGVLGIIRKDKTKRHIFFSLICFVGLAVSSTRTPLFSMVIAIGLYVLVDVKRNKVPICAALSVVGIIGVALLGISRSGSILTNLFNDSGRMELIRSSIDYGFSHFLIGTGYDWTPIISSYSTVVHNYFLQIFNTSGFFIMCFFILLFIKLLRIARKNKLSEEFWMLALVLVIAMFIPDIIGNSIVTVVICLIPACAKYNEVKECNFN